MASLTRSLLALAVVALLQVACAQPGSDQSGESGELGKTCTVFNFGRRSYRPNMRYDLDPVHLNKQINEVKIHDPNRIPQRPGSTLIGEDITVCSEPGVHPHVIRSTPLSFDFFRITARHAKDPIDIVMYVTRYIEVNPVPQWQ
ncbi:hypothetical protein MSG28_001897 [Choristoneura fumiferana]|uniref:Uncharacterized protein n=1 Tax=Choristoneura fumiferana TaxID=7141 RepID=A0ACC0JT30_CHOFU|nr:hypothetical protein MSG28_001897 [Choristoneura fumiferana]